MQFLSIYDVLLPPFYLFVIFIIARNYQRKQIKKHPEYKYYVSGLFAKIFGGIGVVLIYVFYYGGGDTIGYFEGSTYMSNVLIDKSVTGWASIMAGNLTPENWSLFDASTGWPPYWRDHNSFTVIRFTNLFTLLGGRSFFVTTALVAWVTYPGMWRLFRLFREEFPDLEKAMAVSILFMPSVIFWGSAILKDSYTLSATAWLLTCSYQIFFKRRNYWFNIFAMCVSLYVLLNLKPYIFFAAFAGIVIMMTHYSMKKMTNVVLKYTILPIMVVLFMVGGGAVMMKMGTSIGGFYSSVDDMIETAAVMQSDLKMDYYGGNTFDIGSFEPTISGIMGKAPVAMMAGLFRPFLWECKNPVMFISGFENAFLLFMFGYVLILSAVAFFKVGFKYMARTTFDNSLVVFSFVFALSFAFFVGLTTANFGALVRYKIPLIPFFIGSLFIIVRKYNQEKVEDKKEEDVQED